MKGVDTRAIVRPPRRVMPRLTLTLLGGFRAHLAPGAPLAFPTRKAQALLSYLALPAGEAHPRDKLASLLWGSTVETTARTSLRQTLYSLRTSLRRADGRPLHADGNMVSLDPNAIRLDVVEFEQRVAEGTPSALAEASVLYRGELLEGLAVQEPPFEDWLLAERERLHEVALGVLTRLLAHQRAAGSTEAAIQTALRLLALDSLQELAHRALMQLYAETGRRSAALRQYQLCATTLRREVKTEPEKETTALYEQILRGRALPVSTTSADRPANPTEQVVSPRSAALEAERKQVTVLFADLKGFDGAARRPRSRGGPQAPRPRARAHDGGRPPLRGHGEPGDGRRDHGALRRAARPRGPRRAGVLRGAQDAGAGEAIRGARCAARTAWTCRSGSG